MKHQLIIQLLKLPTVQSKDSLLYHSCIEKLFPSLQEVEEKTLNQPTDLTARVHRQIQLMLRKNRRGSAEVLVTVL